jgi:hypothetical protein
MPAHPISATEARPGTNRSSSRRPGKGTELKPEQLPADSAPAQSPWPWAERDGEDLFTPRNQHTTAPSQEHGTPPSPGREALQALQAQAQAEQTAPQPPRQWAFPQLSRSRVITAGLVLALPAVAVTVLLMVAHHHSGPVPAPPVVTQVSGSVASTAPTASAPSATIPLPTPQPADGAAPSFAPVPASQPAPNSAATQAAEVPDGAPPAVDPQPNYRKHHTIPAPSAPPAPPAPQDSSPPPPPQDPPSSADQQSQWEKTTTCDASGRCVDHYNPKPNTPAGG